jgi:hypothetical protein
MTFASSLCGDSDASVWDASLGSLSACWIDVGVLPLPLLVLLVWCFWRACVTRVSVNSGATVPFSSVVGVLGCVAASLAIAACGTLAVLAYYALHDTTEGGGGDISLQVHDFVRLIAAAVSFFLWLPLLIQSASVPLDRSSSFDVAVLPHAWLALVFVGTHSTLVWYQMQVYRHPEYPDAFDWSSVRSWFEVGLGALECLCAVLLLSSHCVLKKRDARRRGRLLPRASDLSVQAASVGGGGGGRYSFLYGRFGQPSSARGSINDLLYDDDDSTVAGELGTREEEEALEGEAWRPLRFSWSWLHPLQVSFAWVGGVLLPDAATRLTAARLPKLKGTRLDTQDTADEFRCHWRREVARGRFSSLCTFYRVCGPAYARLGVLKLCVDMLVFAGPLLLAEVLRNFSASGPTDSNSYLYCLCASLVGSVALSAVLSSQYNYHLSNIVTRINAFLVSELFARTVDGGVGLTMTSRGEFSAGQVTNLMSVDAGNVMNLCQSFHVRMCMCACVVQCSAVQ